MNMINGHSISALFFKSVFKPGFRLLSVVFIVIGLLLLVGPGHADLYYWVDEQGRKHFSDQPHPVAKTLEITPPPVQPDAAQDQAAREKIAELAKQQRTRQQAEIKQRRRTSALQRAAKAKRAKICDQARLKLEKLEAKWRRQRLQGYKPPQRSRYRARKEILAIDIKHYCR